MRAIELAARAHQGQTRKDAQGTPYISHPFAVGLILTKYGAPEHVVAAGILHDVLEDTNVTYEDIVTEFGSEVAELVQWVSIPKGLGDGHAGKAAYLEKLTQSSIEAKLISAADFLHNRADIILSLDQGYNDILNKFELNTATRIKYGTAKLELLIAGLGIDHPLVKEIQDIFKLYDTEFVNIE